MCISRGVFRNERTPFYSHHPFVARFYSDLLACASRHAGAGLQYVDFRRDYNYTERVTDTLYGRKSQSGKSALAANLV